MVKKNFFPVSIDVTALTFFAKASLVLVIFPVTRVTVGFDLVLVYVSLVTTDAFDIDMLSQQRKFGLPVMIEKEFLPSFF